MSRPAQGPVTEDEPPGPRDRRYAAFLSYRHADNREEGRRWASWLHHVLETYEVPAEVVGTRNERGETIPPRIYPVFRDEEELPADADLSRPILRALKASRTLVVLCSPGAVASRFVADEVSRFQALHGRERVIAAILAGEPNASTDAAKQASGIGPDQECFPEALRWEVEANDPTVRRPAEPLAADFRLPDGREGWTSPAALREALEAEGRDRRDVDRKVEAYARRLEVMTLKIVAGILGVPLGMLRERDQAYQLEKARRRTQVLRRWLAAVGVLALLAIAAGVYAMAKQREAEARRAEVVAVLASSDFQQGNALVEAGETTARGIAHLARAYREGGHDGAGIRLWTLLQQRAFWVPAPASDGPQRPQMSVMVIPRAFDTVTLGGVEYRPDYFAVSSDESTVATIVNGDPLDNETRHVRVWSSDGTPRTPWIAPAYTGDFYSPSLSSAHLSHDGKYLAVVVDAWREPQYVAVYEVRPEARRLGGDVPATGRGSQYQFVGFSRVAFLDPAPGDEQWMYGVLLLTASARGDAAVYAVSAEVGEPRLVASASHADAVVTAAVDAQHEWLMSGSADREVHVTDLRGRRGTIGAPVRLEHVPQGVRRIGPDRVRIYTDGVEDTDLTLVRPMRAVPPSDAVLAELLRDHPSSRTVRQVAPTTLQVRDGERVVGERSFATTLAAASLSPAGDRIAATDVDFVTEVWTADLAARIGFPLDERKLFRPRETPSEVRAALLSKAGDLLLTRSHHWNAPNLAVHWITLWDVRSGMPLSDRFRLEDDSLSDDALDHARFHDGDRFVVCLHGQPSGSGHAVWYQVRPPRTARAWLCDYAEALGGYALDPEGLAVPVPDRWSTLHTLQPELLESGLAPNLSPEGEGETR